VSENFDRTKTLQQLEMHDWGEPAFDSPLVKTCHRLRRKPLHEFTAEDLRIMIGQGIGLPYLIPLALERLEVDPLVGGDYYAGDLLKNVLVVQQPFWIAHPHLAQRIRRIVSRVEDLLPSLAEAYRETVRELLVNANRFLTE
jgi:CDI immunity proteins